MLKRRRVYQVAKDFRVSSEELLVIMVELGIEVTNHMSPLEEDQLVAVQAHFEPPTEDEAEPVESDVEVADSDADSDPDSEVVEAVTDEPETAVPEPAAPQVDEELVAELQQTEGDQSEVAAEEVAEPLAEPVETEPVAEEAPSPPTTEPGDKKPDGDGSYVKSSHRRRRVVVNPDKSGRKGSGDNAIWEAAKPASSGPPTGGGADTRPKRRRKRRQRVDQTVVDANVQRTLSEMERGRTRVRHDRGPQQTEIEGEQEDPTVLKVAEFTSVGELADLMDAKSSEVIGQAMKMGLMVTLNQRLDLDTLTLLADEFSFQVELAEEFSEAEVDEEISDNPEDLRPRPPVITVMGHVDHGKTSLLDFIRRENVISGEAGGITQHIGAYHVDTDHGAVTFLDTPGHHTFTAMRARGAQLTDVVVLIVAANDGVMPQTVEAIDHARAASVPVVVAVNKIDLPDANPSRVKQELSQHNVLVEEFGGSTQIMDISAMRGDNVDSLLELLALESELLDLKANPDRAAVGAVVEAKLDKGRGPVATVLVQHGTLRVSDVFVAGLHAGRVRAMLDERGHPLVEAGPGTPVQVLGFDDVAEAGDPFRVMPNEREARDLAQRRQAMRREQTFRQAQNVSLVDLHSRITAGDFGQLPIIVKGDVAGSVEALCDALNALSTDEVGVSVIHSATGAITESDVLLATASGAIIIGFHVRPEPRAREVAAQEYVDVRLYDVIYEAVDEVKQALSGLLSAEIKEQVNGEAEVRELFKVLRSGTVGGSMVREGVVTRGELVRVVRDGVVLYQGEVSSLRRFKDDVHEVQSGFECGIGVSNFNDLKIGDVLETFERIEVARTLE